MGPDRVLSTGTRLRVAVVVFVLLINAVHGSALMVLPWALLVVGVDLVTGATLVIAPLRPRDRQILGMSLTLLAAAIAGLSLTAGAGGLLLVIVPLFRAGETWGRQAVLACIPVFVVPAVIAWVVAVPTTPDLEPGSMLLWVALAVCLGALAVWSWHLAPQQTRDDKLANEAAWLLARLEGLAGELRGGFDPATSAEHLLDAVPAAGPQARSAVLIGAPQDRPVPLALRGSLRVPWSDPRDDNGVIGDAWAHGRANVQVDVGDDDRVVVAAPLKDTNGRQIGILVSDSLPGPVKPAGILSDTTTVVRQHQGLVAVALAFGGLRERAGIEERERLARQIHDGVAQELVALGLRIDRLKRLPDDQVRAEIAELRAEVGRILADVRSHIGDLRLTVRPEGGLGAAISSQLQVFGASTGVIVQSRLSESSFRLPAHVETGLYRIFLDFLADTRREHTVSEVQVFLASQAPLAEMSLRRSGPSRLTESELSRHLPASVGAVVSITGTEGGTEVSVQLVTAPEGTVVFQERLPPTS